MEGVTALDKKEGDITSEVKVIGIVDTYEAGEYPLTYIVKNSTGLSDEVSRTVEVLPEGICIEPGYIEWHSDTIYVKGDAVTYSNSIWEAKWWTQGDIPGNEQWGPWKKIKDIDCDNKP
ncbi:chitinase [Vibrio astriarenae]|nr:chitinase [Vibrio sp. C7]